MVVSHVDTPLSGSPRSAVTGSIGPRWTCALVNNMPDGAFVQTEGQFLDLLDVGSGDQDLDVRLYALPGVPRGEATALRIAERYRPMADLYDDAPDLLIVTGANPVEPALEDEPIWGDLSRLLTWASGAVPSMVLSCLSAHAALTVFDGLERESLPSKCTGVFTHRVESGEPLTAGLGRTVVLPHSRVSTVSTDRVRAAGYDIPVDSEEVGWSVATRQVDRSAVVLVQAHPEYGPTSLLREYQRDVRRFVRHERDGDPRPAPPLFGARGRRAAGGAPATYRRWTAGSRPVRVVPLRRRRGPGPLGMAVSGHPALRQLADRCSSRRTLSRA